MRKTRGFYFVRAGGEDYLCRISNRLRKDLVFPTADKASTRRGVVEVRDIGLVDPVAVGDRVRLVDGGGGTGSIKEVLPRRNRFSRMIHRGRPLEQVLAANVDLVIGVFAAARPDLRWDLLDRFLIQAEILRVTAVVLITKTDLVEAEGLKELCNLYGGMGYTIAPVCAPGGEGIDALAALLAGRFSALVGESGVGKTTLLNALQPGLERRVGDVRNDKRGRGRHTTTMVEAIELPGDGWVVDTPGINDIGLHEPDGRRADPAWYFPEMRPLIEGCRFGEGCTHVEEPGCAVLEGVEAGTVTEERHHSYVAFRAELAAPPGERRG